jgi:predicted acetyltransferase
MSQSSEEKLELIPPTAALAEPYLDMCKEEIADDNRVSQVLPTTHEELPAIFRRWRARERSGDESTGGVPQSEFWLVRNGTEVIGSSRLRHFLTPALETISGHVDYGVRPSARRKGYGTRLLSLTLEKARLMGMREVVVMCRKANIGSARVIERNGGVLLGEVSHPTRGIPILRYLIRL